MQFETCLSPGIEIGQRRASRGVDGSGAGEMSQTFLSPHFWQLQSPFFLYPILQEEHPLSYHNHPHLRMMIYK
jgi:hypothetical protein